MKTDTYCMLNITSLVREPVNWYNRVTG